MHGITLCIPGGDVISLRHLVLDYNGTLAAGGKLLPGVAERLRTLTKSLQIHVLTADTYGGAKGNLKSELEQELDSGRIAVAVLTGNPSVSGAREKLTFIQKLGEKSCCAVGNGVIDRLMLEAAGLSICVMGPEGCSPGAFSVSDICVSDICDALDLLINPHGCVANENF